MFGKQESARGGKNTLKSNNPAWCYYNFHFISNILMNQTERLRRGEGEKMRNESNTKEKRKVLEHLPQILRDHPEREREREWREADIASVCIENAVWEIEPEFSCSKSGFFSILFFSSKNKSLVFFQSKIKLENSVECRDKEKKKARESPQSHG